MTASSFADEDPETALTAAPTRAGVAVGIWPLEFLRYFSCSAAALTVDWGVYSAVLSMSLSWSIAAPAGFCSGLFVAYWLSIRFVFAQRSLKDARIEFLLFTLIGLGGLLLTQLILWMLIERFGRGPHESKLAAAGLVFLFNFAVRKLMLFQGQARAVSSSN